MQCQRQLLDPCDVERGTTPSALCQDIPDLGLGGCLQPEMGQTLASGGEDRLRLWEVRQALASPARDIRVYLTQAGPVVKPCASGGGDASVGFVGVQDGTCFICTGHNSVFGRFAYAPSAGAHKTIQMVPAW